MFLHKFYKFLKQNDNYLIILLNTLNFDLKLVKVFLIIKIETIIYNNGSARPDDYCLLFINLNICIARTIIIMYIRIGVLYVLNGKLARVYFEYKL